MLKRQCHGSKLCKEQGAKMSQPIVASEPSGPLKLNVKAIRLTEHQFAYLCRENPELRLELTAQQELVILSPTGSKTGWRNSKLTQHLANWADKDGTGLAFDSSTGFTLPNGAKRSPDASWVRRGRWDVLTEEQQVRICTPLPRFRFGTALKGRQLVCLAREDAGVHRQRSAPRLVD